MKTEKTISEIMRRFKCSRDDAMTAPDLILVTLEHLLPLTQEEIEFGRKVAARLEKERC